MEELVLKNDFYEWAYSDFLVNNQRGHLAEYIIAKALNTVSQKRLEWDPVDIKYKNLKIEVKSCAYIQAWEQKDFSKISFDIVPTSFLNLNFNKQKRISLSKLQKKIIFQSFHLLKLKNILTI